MNVQLTSHAAKRISDVLAATDDGREMGGPLLGYERDGVIVIDDAAGEDWLGEPVEAFSYPVQLQDETALELERLHREIGSPSRWLGEWHSHPKRNVTPLVRDGMIVGYRDVGGARPSPNDELGWMRDACLYGAPWVGLIVAPGEVGAWVLERLPGPGLRATQRRVPVVVVQSELDPIRGVAA